MKRSLHAPARIFCLLSILSLSVLVGSAFAQDILLDQLVRAGDLRLYPSLREPNVYYYVSDQARLATDDSGRPQFSLLRYENGGPNTGGGIFHAVVSLEVTDEQLQEAERDLRSQNGSATIRGPVPFDGGTFALVTSFTGGNDQLTRQVVGLGYAPVLDGQKAAVSIQLTQQGSQILWTSLQMANGDLSFSFEMELSGYRSPIEAKVTANFDDIFRHDAFSAAATTPLLAGDIMTEFEKLTQNRSIIFEQIGEDADLESLAQSAYNKLLEVAFEPTRATTTVLPGSQEAEHTLLDRATKMLNAARTEVRDENTRIRTENERRRREVAAARLRAYEKRRAASEASTESPSNEPAQPNEGQSGVYQSLSMKSAGVTPPKPEAIPIYVSASDTVAPEPIPEQDLPEFAAVASYRMKRQRRTGTYTFNFNKYTVENRRMRFDENIGDLSAVASNPDYFRVVDLADLSIQRRNVKAYVDGLNAEQMREHLNFVTVLLRKKHGGGASTSTDEVRIDADSFSEEGNDFELTYNWRQEDANVSPAQWLEYDYDVTWSFRGLEPVSQSETAHDANAITLKTPYRVREVTLDTGDPAVLKELGVRLITVRIYDPSGERMVVNESLRPDREPASKIVKFLQATDQVEYPTEISWMLRGAVERTTGRVQRSANVLFLDEVPEE